MNILFEKQRKINRDLQDYFCNDNLNYCRFILPKNEGKVSVVAEYKAPNICYTLDKDLRIIEGDINEYYYGVSPKVDSEMIINAISKGYINNADKLEEFIRENNTLFMADEMTKDFLLSLAKYFIISIAMNFGIKIKLCEGIHYDDKCCLRKIDDSTENEYITLCGPLTNDIIHYYSGLKFTYDNSINMWRVSDYGEDGLNINDIYLSPNNIKLVNGEVFYSGVLLRAKELKSNDIYDSNSGVSSLCICFERSTYGTVFTFDNYYVDHFPFNEKDKEVLNNFYRLEDKTREELLLNDIDSFEEYRYELLNQINLYLSKSYNVNQLGVTANIITKEGVLIYGIRDNKAIDNNKIYPSVNGNAELKDVNVSFYQNSSYEDYPSIDINSMRKDFNGEIYREACAELRIGEINKDDWNYYGLAISGIIPKTFNSKRRMHFNILGFQDVYLGFCDIYNRQRNAVEYYENKEIRGIKVILYENYLDKIKNKIKNFSSLIMSSSGIISSIFTLTLFLLSVYNNNQLSLDTANSYVSAFFASLVIITTFFTIIGKVKLWNFYRNKIERIEFINPTILEDNDKKSITYKINNLLSNKEVHPIAYAIIRCYFENIIGKLEK